MKLVYFILILLFSQLSVSKNVEPLDYRFDQNKSGYDWDYLLFVQLWPPSWLNEASNYNFTNDYFTVHGIWPEYWNGSWPQYCNVTRFSYDKLTPMQPELRKFWTDFHNPVEFWKHEYYKHASCAFSDKLLAYEHHFFRCGLDFRNMLPVFKALSHSGIYPTSSHKYPVSSIQLATKKLSGFDTVVICDENNELNEIIFCVNKKLQLFDCPQSELKKQCHNHEVWYKPFPN